jgi:hypothetical protein
MVAEMVDSVQAAGLTVSMSEFEALLQRSLLAAAGGEIWLMLKCYERKTVFRG